MSLYAKINVQVHIISRFWLLVGLYFLSKSKKKKKNDCGTGRRRMDKWERQNGAIQLMRFLPNTVEFQWLEYLWDRENTFETGVVRVNEC